MRRNSILIAGGHQRRWSDATGGAIRGGALEAPVARVTLTLGARKRDVLERSIAHDSGPETAIGAVLARMAAPVDLFWAP